MNAASSNYSRYMQRKDQLQSKFQVLRVKWRHRNKGISMFLKDCHGIKFECEEIFYQFPKAGIELLHYRDIIKLSKEEVCVRCT